MKRTTFWLMIALFAGITAVTALAQSQPQSQSLGDVARDQRKKKYEKPVASKVYTDDNLPADNTMKPAAPEAKADADCPGCPPTDGTAPTASTATAAGDKTAAEKAADPNKPSPGSVDEFKKNAEEWKKKVDDQKKAVEGLQKQLNDLQQQYRLRASAYYSDAGLRLRDGGSKWADDEQQFRKAIDDKQKELEAAKQKLSDVQEQGHKAGAPSSALE